MNPQRVTLILTLLVTGLGWLVAFRSGTAQSSGAYRTYLPTVSRFEPFDPSLHDFVGLYVHDSSKIVTLRLGSIFPRVIFDNGAVVNVAWSSNATRIFISTAAAAYLVNHDGTGLMQLPIEGTYIRGWWSPDGERLFIGADGGYLVNRDGTGLLQLPIEGTVDRASWAPDGSQLFIETLQQRYYVSSRDGADVMELPIEESASGWRWSPDSRHFIVREHGGGFEPKFKVLDTATGTYNLVSGSEESADDGILDITWSPDSSTIIYTKDTEPAYGYTWYQIFVTNADGGDPRNLVPSTTEVIFERWIYNGEQFIARVGWSGNTLLALYRADGSFIAYLLTESGARVETVATNNLRFIYSADSSLYLYDLRDNSSARISPPICLDSKFCGYGMNWSPSGDAIAICDYERYSPDPNERTFIVPLKPVPQVPSEPYITGTCLWSWLTDRFVSDDGRILEDLETGTRRVLATDDDDPWLFFGWRKLPEE